MAGVARIVTGPHEDDHQLQYGFGHRSRNSSAWCITSIRPRRLTASRSTSGAEALWGRETLAGLAHGCGVDGTRLDAEVGYGLPVGSRFVGTPQFSVWTSEHGRDYRLGYRLGALGAEGLRINAQRRESPVRGGTDQSRRLRTTGGSIRVAKPSTESDQASSSRASSTRSTPCSPTPEEAYTSDEADRSLGLSPTSGQPNAA